MALLARPLVPFALLLLATALHAQRPFLTRYYDLRGLGVQSTPDWPSPSLEAGVDPRPLLISSIFLDNLEADYPDVRHERREQSTVGGTVRFVDDALDVALSEIESRRIFLDARAGHLIARGPEAWQAEVEALVGGFVALAEREVELELWRVSSEALEAVPHGVMGPQRARELRARLQPLERARTTAPLGFSARLGELNREAVVVDYDVEATRYRSVSDPQIGVLHEGVELGVLAVELEPERYSVRVWGRQGTLERPLRWKELECFDDARIALPSTSSAVFLASGAVRSGGALVIAQDANEDGGLVLFVHGHGGALPDAMPGQLLPLGALAVQPMVEEPPPLWGPWPSGGYLPDVIFDPLSGASRSSPYAQLQVQEELERLLDERDLQGVMLRVADQLYVRGEPEYVELVSTELERWRALLEGGCSLEVRHGVLDAAASEGLARGELDDGQLAELLPWRALAPTLLAHTVGVFAGYEHAYLLDYDIEIAQGAVAPDPILGVLYEGLVFWAIVDRLSDGGLRLWYDAQVGEQIGEFEEEALSFVIQPGEGGSQAPLATEDALGGTIEVASGRRGLSRGQAQLEAGEWRLLWSAPWGEGRSYAIAVRASWLGEDDR